jgi:subtilase family serine protease
VLCLASCTAETTPSAPATPKRTLPVTTPAVTPVPAHVATLTAALRKMKQTHNATLLGSPGAADILDYGIGDLWQQGIDGTGTTIALVGAWDDPNINLAALRIDQEWGLPAPDITTIYPTGTGHLPAKCPAPMVALGFYGSCDGWAGELELDVESAHLVAPYARILIVVAPPDSEIADDDASQVAPPEMMRAVEYVSDHHLADVVSISDDTGESTYSYHKPEITAQDPGELVAAAAGIPLLVGTGDCGVVQNLAVASSQCGNTSARPDTAAWDDSPWVTAVGGSVPDLDPATGAHRGPDRVWSEGRAAEGAGHSGVYARPDYQSQVADGTMRSVPDITMDARLGTSESTPLFGGVLALAAQLNHGGVGPINNALYEILGPKGARAGITDVVTGHNSVTTAPASTWPPAGAPSTRAGSCRRWWRPCVPRRRSPTPPANRPLPP